MKVQEGDLFLEGTAPVEEKKVQLQTGLGSLRQLSQAHQLLFDLKCAQNGLEFIIEILPFYFRWRLKPFSSEGVHWDVIFIDLGQAVQECWAIAISFPGDPIEKLPLILAL